MAAKDEFSNNKNVNRDDMMAAHLVPPQMMEIMPSNVGGLGMRRKRPSFFFEMSYCRHRKEWIK